LINFYFKEKKREASFAFGRSYSRCFYLLSIIIPSLWISVSTFLLSNLSFYSLHNLLKGLKGKIFANYMLPIQNLGSKAKEDRFPFIYLCLFIKAKKSIKS
jgi:hypothetical protein